MELLELVSILCLSSMGEGLRVIGKWSSIKSIILRLSVKKQPHSQVWILSIAR
jgi:hypothetical protein